MSDDNKSGSDLDIFEGLGKKSAGRVSAAPPPPASGNVPSAPPAPPPNSNPRAEMKRTLVGIPGPAQPPSAAGVSAAPSPSPSMPPPPPPPVSQGRVSVPPPLPSQSGQQQRASLPPTSTSPSKPPPPPGRGSLPNMNSTIPSAQTLPSMPSPLNGNTNGASSSQKISQVPPPPASARTASAALAASVTSDSVVSSAPAAPTPPSAPATSPSPATQGGKLDMDWDDDQEATHVFDKDSKDELEAAALAGPESRRPEHASMDDILSSPRPIPPAAGAPPPQQQVTQQQPMHIQSSTATLSGAFGALGQPRDSNGASQFKSGAPPSQSLRSAPPPPPASMRPPNPSTTTAPIPPPPPPGQTTTVPMHMPMQQPMNGAMHQQPGMPQQSLPPQPSLPPYQAPPPVSQPPMPQMPPISRAMEQTAVVPRQQSKAGLIIALIVGVFAAMAIAGFFLMPRTGTLVVNVADTKGGAVAKLEVTVDDKKVCDSAPCIVRDVQSGVHQVKVSAAGFDPPAPRAVTVESRKDSTLDFNLSGAAAAAASGAGTGLKVSGTQTGVRLLVDGKEYGPLPQEIHDLAAGEHKVRIVGSDRYAAQDKTVVVKQDEVQDLGSVQLKVLKGKATIQLGTPGAKVFLVNGATRKEVPQFPIAIDFDPNEHWQLEAKMLGMDDYSSPISFDDGQAEKTITVTLSPKGTSAPPTPVAAVTTPRPTPPQTFAPPAPAPVPAPPKPDTAAAANGEAFLNINSKPASTVLLDGKPLGPTPRIHVSVTPGTHTVLFVNAEESLKKSVSVTVAAGETKPVIGKLRD